MEPQTPPPLLQPRPTPPADESLGPGPLAEAVTAGLDAADVDRSPAPAVSPGVKPNPKGDGSGVVERLALFSAGLDVGTAVWPATGREPMGPTDPMGPALDLDGAWREEDESAPPGEEVEVTGCSGKMALMAELGEDELFARDGDCKPEAPSAAATAACVRPNGSTPRGEDPRTPADEGVPAA